MAIRRRFLIRTGFVTLAIVVSAIAVIQRPRFSAPEGSDSPTPQATEALVARTPTGAFIATGPQRAVFPYSVVPGGVNSVDELRRAIAADAVVARHYTDFDLSHARVERLAVPRIAHVSYRVDAHVYWTRQVLVLPAGERVITDGTHVARTRCGNQIATEPGLTSPAEPSTDVLDTPAIQYPPCPVDPTMCTPAAGGVTSGNGFVPPPSGLVPPLEPPAVIGTSSPFADAASGSVNDAMSVSRSHHDDPPVVIFDRRRHDPTSQQAVPIQVPEPGSLMLMLTAGAGFVLRCLRAKRISW